MPDSILREPLTPRQQRKKRAFDVLVASFLLGCTWWLLTLGWIAARLSTGERGFFVQQRVGKGGALIRVRKLRTMRNPESAETTGRTVVTVRDDPRITRIGSLLRRTKLDELPQLLNVLVGDMSLVGPRPDVPGYADRLQGDDRLLLTVRPGITGPATVWFRHEEQLLAQQPDPIRFNDTALWPEKVRLNRFYLENFSLWRDIIYCVMTLPLPSSVRCWLETRYLPQPSCSADAT